MVSDDNNQVRTNGQQIFHDGGSRFVRGQCEVVRDELRKRKRAI